MATKRPGQPIVTPSKQQAMMKLFGLNRQRAQSVALVDRPVTATPRPQSTVLNLSNSSSCSVGASSSSSDVFSGDDAADMLLRLSFSPEVESLSVKYDISKWVNKKLSVEEKLELVQNIDKSKPPLGFVYPKTLFGNHNRAFQGSYLAKYSWLIYSTVQNGCYCLPCVLFYATLDSHAACKYHQQHVTDLIDLKANSSDFANRIENRFSLAHQTQFYINVSLQIIQTKLATEREESQHLEGFDRSVAFEVGLRSWIV